MAGRLGVVSAEPVARGVGLGIAQTNHGKRSGLARLRPGDWLVYYSPHERLGTHSPVHAFTAIGRITDSEIWQADEGEVTPWRRRVDYRVGARRTPVADLRDRLDLTAEPNWGSALRRGLIPLTDHDLAVLHREMTGEPIPDHAPPLPAGDPARGPAAP